jgi:hypothetical protein
MCHEAEGFAQLAEGGEPLYLYEVWKPLGLVRLFEFIFLLKLWIVLCFHTIKLSN